MKKRRRSDDASLFADLDAGIEDALLSDGIVKAERAEERRAKLEESAFVRAVL